jgi:SAM-dependent methyltransferase
MGSIGYNRNTGIAAKGREYFFSKVIENFYRDSKLGGGILEIGSGTGDFLVHASSKGIKVKGIEPNEDLFLIALERVDQASIEKCELETFSTECTFDLVFSNSVIEHVNEPVEFIEKASDLLTENGLIVITAPTPADYFWDDPTHKRPYTTKSFIELAYLTNLELVYCSTTFGFLIGKKLKSPFVYKVLNLLPGHFGSNIIAVYRKSFTSESTR